MGIIERLGATRLTSTDMGFLMLKFSFVVGLCLLLNILFGVVLGLLTFFLMEKFIILTYGVEPLNATDKNVFYD